jgi:thiol peroxidase
VATVTLKGNTVHTAGTLPSVGAIAPDFTLTGADLGDIKLSDYAGKRVILNVFHSIDTGTCAASVRRFNAEASNLGDDVVVLCISRDLPFAQGRFCGAEGLDRVINASEMKNTVFSDAYGLRYIDGPVEGLHSRCVIVVDKDGKVTYTEQVAETTEEPDYASALAAL